MQWLLNLLDTNIVIIFKYDQSIFSSTFPPKQNQCSVLFKGHPKNRDQSTILCASKDLPNQQNKQFTSFPKCTQLHLHSLAGEKKYYYSLQFPNTAGFAVHSFSKDFWNFLGHPTFMALMQDVGFYGHLNTLLIGYRLLVIGYQYRCHLWHFPSNTNYPTTVMSQLFFCPIIIITGPIHKRIMQLKCYPLASLHISCLTSCLLLMF